MPCSLTVFANNVRQQLCCVIIFHGGYNGAVLPRIASVKPVMSIRHESGTALRQLTEVIATEASRPVSLRAEVENTEVTNAICQLHLALSNNAPSLLLMRCC